MTTEKRQRGEGCIFEKKGSRFLWVKWHDANGKPHWESTGTDNPIAAKRFLRGRLAKVDAGETVIAGKVSYGDAEKALRANYETTGKRNLKEVEKRLTPLRAFFGGSFLRAIDEDRITEYVKTRKAAKKANGTINRELNILSRLLRLAYRNKKVSRLPFIEMLEESAPRAGFFEEPEYAEVRKRLRTDLQIVTDIGYTYGWRIRDEVLPLTWKQVDLDAGTLRLEPGTTKNGEGRVVRLTPGLTQALGEQRERVLALQRKLGRLIPQVFPHLDGRLAGTPVRDFRRAWKTACKRAGCPTMLRHDFRRTAVRNMERGGVARSIAMQVTGHKTESVYRRYAIVSEADQLAATEKILAVQARDAAAHRPAVTPLSTDASA